MLHLLLFVSPQVFQTFECEDYPEIGTRYLRADRRIECNSPRHTGYMVYAAVMIFLCECLGHITQLTNVCMVHSYYGCVVVEEFKGTHFTTYDPPVYWVLLRYWDCFLGLRQGTNTCRTPALLQTWLERYINIRRV